MSKYNEDNPIEISSESEEYYSSDTSCKNDPNIQLMLSKMPEFDDLFAVHNKLGEGTFSSVYMCTLKSQKHIPLAIRKKFAVKYLIPTSHPERMERELKCLHEIGGEDNVSGIDLCIRNGDSVAFIMPCLQHNKYMEYMFDMGHKETQVYMKNLLLAVSRVHSFDIVHRDIKPSNFLYDRQYGRFLLVDFGLAQHVDELGHRFKKLKQINDVDFKKKRKRSSERENSCDKIMQIQKRQFIDHNTESIKSPLKQLNINSSSANKRKPSTFNCNTLKTKSHLKPSAIKSSKNSIYDFNIKQEDGSLKYNKTHNNIQSRKQNPTSIHSIAGNQEIHRNISFTTDVGSPISNRTMTNLNKSKSLLPSVETNKSPVKLKLSPYSKVSPVKSNRSTLSKSSHIAPSCNCYGRPMVCNTCMVRQAQIAPRAGTPGFRPPEVLLRYTKQTTAVDLWACGVIFLCLLSRCYPFFRAPDDLTNLAEIITLLGLEKVKKAARVLGRQLNVSSQAKAKPDYELDVFCKLLRSRPKQDGTSGDLKKDFPPSAYDLLVKLLDPNPYTRITAKDALKHDFFKEKLQ